MWRLYAALPRWSVLGAGPPPRPAGPLPRSSRRSAAARSGLLGGRGLDRGSAHAGQRDPGPGHGGAGCLEGTATPTVAKSPTRAFQFEVVGRRPAFRSVRNDRLHRDLVMLEARSRTGRGRNLWPGSFGGPRPARPPRPSRPAARRPTPSRPAGRRGTATRPACRGCGRSVGDQRGGGGHGRLPAGQELRALQAACRHSAPTWMVPSGSARW